MKASLLPFLCGVLLMLAAATEPADGQEKKDPALKAPFDQYVKVEAVTAKGEKFLKEMVPAYRPTTKAPIWRVSTQRVGPSGKGLTSAVVTDKAGKQYKIEKVTEGAGYLQLWIAPEPNPS